MEWMYAIEDGGPRDTLQSSGKAYGSKTLLRQLLRHLIHERGLTPGQALSEIFEQRRHQLGPRRLRQDRRHFYLFAAQLARGVVLEDMSSPNQDVASSRAMSRFLWWIGVVDPMCVRIVDLHYFAGLSSRETAATLRISTTAVECQLRFVSAHLEKLSQIGASRPSAPPTGGDVGLKRPHPELAIGTTRQ